MRARTSLADVLALARDIRAARPDAGLIIFTYLNPILRYGLSRFADDAAAAGADGVLVIDMIVEEAAEYLAEMDRVGLAPVFLAAPTSPDERLEAIAAHQQGIRLRHLARRHHRQAAEHDCRCSRAGRTHCVDGPAADGRGLRHLQCANMSPQVAEFADAAAIGSAIVALIERSTPESAPGEVARFITGLRPAVSATGPLKTPAATQTQGTLIGFNSCSVHRNCWPPHSDGSRRNTRME